MDRFATLPAAERACFFRETAARLNLGSAKIMEKDFWVCRTLQKIFSIANLPGPLFKGGIARMFSLASASCEAISSPICLAMDTLTASATKLRYATILVVLFQTGCPV